MKKMAGMVLAAVVALSAAAQKLPAHEDQWLVKPVDQRTFQTYLEFFRYDSNLPFNVKVLGTEQPDPSFSKEHVSFQSTPGEQVTANLYRPAGTATAKRPTIVLLHGGGGRGKDGPPPTVLGTLLARAGFQVLSPDLQYFGERASDKMFTTFTEQEKHEKLYNQPSAYLSWVIQNVKDISRALDFVVQERNADPQRIALVGISRGAIVAEVAGGVERRFAVVVLEHGGHFDALENGHMPAACPANYIGHISPRPLLMINGTRDTDMIKESSVEPLYRLAKMPKQILWEDAGHQLPTEEHRTYMLQWLREKLK
jgi:poly(3-hydroxybutyrate) depolymerase